MHARSLTGPQFRKRDQVVAEIHLLNTPIRRMWAFVVIHSMSENRFRAISASGCRDSHR